MRLVNHVIVAMVLCLVAVLFLGPREEMDDSVTFSAAISEDSEQWLADTEAAVAGVIPGAEKEIVWADPATRAKTPFSVVYLHGFSATKEELRPAPDDVAQALGANLFLTRLTGHGRDGAALAEATATDWLRDTAEALEIGRRIGDRTILIGTSTGGALAALATQRADLAQGLAGVVFISPNFELQAMGSSLLTAPYARVLTPILLGETRAWEAANDEHAKWWTTSYPSVALTPMAAVAKAARAGAYDTVNVPALFLYSDGDTVVSPKATRKIAGRWGAPAEITSMTPPADPDASDHVIAGRILNPTMTAPVVEKILSWVKTL